MSDKTDIAENKLTVKMQAFADAYLANGGNGTRAIYEAGFDVKNPETASAMASEYLRIPKVKAYLDAARANLRELAAKQGITPEVILKMRAMLAMSDVRNIVAWNGDGVAEYKPSESLTDEEAFAIQEFTQTADGVKIKLHDKAKNLDALEQMLGLKDDKNVNVNISLGEALRNAEKRMIDVTPEGGE